MSKERARRRQEREAVRVAAEAKRLRRERRRVFWRRFRLPRRRRVAWGLGRRSTGQRAVTIGVGLGLVWVVWYLVDAWPLRIALWLLLVLVLPVFTVVTFDRKGMKL